MKPYPRQMLLADRCCRLTSLIVAVSLSMPLVAQDSTSTATQDVLELDDVQVTLITRVRVAAPESAPVREVLCKAGDLVGEGDSLVQLDDQILAGTAEAAVIEARLAEIESENDVDLRYAQKSTLVARADLNRSEEAVRAFPKSISRSELDQLRLLLDRAELSAEQLDKIAAMLRPRVAVPGEILVRQGERGSEMFFLSSGAAEVDLGDHRIRLGRGDFFGEMALLDPRRRRGADVTALSYCQLLILREEDLRTLFATQPGLRDKISKIAHERQEMNRGGLSA